MKRNILIYLLMILVLVGTSFATSGYEGLFSDEYNSGRQDVNYVGDFSYPNYEDSLSTSSTAGYKPIVADIDNDGTNEILVHSGNTLYIYNATGDGISRSLNTEVSYSLAGAQITNGVSQDFYTFPTLDYRLGYFVVTDDDNLHIITHDGSTYSKQTENFTMTGNVGSHLTCFRDTAISVTCVFGSTSSEFLVYSSTEGFSNTGSLFTYANKFKTRTTGYNTNVPLYVNNTDDDIIVIGDSSGLKAINVTDPTAPTVYTNWFTSGLASGLVTDYTYNFMNIYDLVGDNVFCVGGEANNVDETTIFYCKDTSDTYKISDASSGNSNYLSSPVFMGRLDDSDELRVCMSAYWGVTWTDQIRCYDSTYTLSTYSTRFGSPNKISTCHLDSDIYDEVLDNGYIHEFANASSHTSHDYTAVLTSGTEEDTYCADVDGDSSLEILQQTTTGSLKIVFANEYSGVNPLALEGSLYNYDSNENCVNQTTTYKAKECLTEPYANCSYSNVAGATERIGVACGDNLTINWGVWSNSNPQVSCNYTNASTYEEQIYIQSNHFPSDLSNSWLFNITSGNSASCNQNILTVFEITPVDESGTPTETPIDSGYTVGGLHPTVDTGNDTVDDTANSIIDNWKLILASILILIITGVGAGIMAYFKAHGEGIAVGGVVGFALSLVLVTAIGLIPVWVLIVVTILVIAILVLFKGLIFRSRGV